MARWDEAEFVRMADGSTATVQRDDRLAKTNGRAEMFYVGETPWHGLGTKVEGSATSAIAMEAAGLGWTVSTRLLKTEEGLDVPMGRAVVRDDKGIVFGTVGARYSPVQNADAFSFLDSLVGDHQLEYETAGAIGQGERVWMLARVPGELRVPGTDDVTKPYLLLHNTHDGTGALRCHFTGVRVVCRNTLALANRNGEGAGINIRHTGSIHDKIKQARETLQIAAKVYERAQESISRMAGVKLDLTSVTRYFEELIPDPVATEADPKIVAIRNAREARGEMFRLFDEGAGAEIPEIRHTVWTAYNAVTEYVDHVVKTKDVRKALGADARESRLASAWFGPGAQLKAQAWERAMAYASN